jgi:hypothetical protein
MGERIQIPVENGESTYVHPEFPRYRITTNGRLYSLRAKRFLKPIAMGNYQGFQLVDANGSLKKRYLHRLVLEAVIGPCPAGMEARHLNGDRYDNRADNLAWGTHQENVDDKRRHGTTLHGSRNPMAKLTEVQADEIRRMVADGHQQREAAARFNVSPMTVSRIVRRQAWVGDAA